jgi:hypothetical protein
LTGKVRVEIKLRVENLHIKDAVFRVHMSAEIYAEPNSLSVKTKVLLTFKERLVSYFVGSNGIVYGLLENTDGLIVVECLLAADDISEEFNSVQTAVRMGNARIMNETNLQP